MLCFHSLFCATSCRDKLVKRSRITTWQLNCSLRKIRFTKNISIKNSERLQGYFPCSAGWHFIFRDSSCLWWHRVADTEVEEQPQVQALILNPQEDFLLHLGKCPNVILKSCLLWPSVIPAGVCNMLWISVTGAEWRLHAIRCQNVFSSPMSGSFSPATFVISEQFP